MEYTLYMPSSVALTEDLDRHPHLREPLTCRSCGAIDTPQILPGKGPHAYAAQCRHCGASIQWVSRYTPGERQARRQRSRQQALEARLPSQAQLDYLQTLGDSG